MNSAATLRARRQSRDGELFLSSGERLDGGSVPGLPLRLRSLGREAQAQISSAVLVALFSYLPVELLAVVAALVPASYEIRDVGMLARSSSFYTLSGSRRLREVLVTVDGPWYLCLAVGRCVSELPPPATAERMSFHCWTSRLCRFLAASSTLRSWFLGRFGMMGPVANALSLLSSDSVPGYRSFRTDGLLLEQRFSSTCVRLCRNCHRSVTCTASGEPLARASR